MTPENSKPPSKWLRASLSRAKNRAKRVGVDYELTSLETPSRCPVLGFELDYTTASGKGPKPASPSIDRYIPSLGYVQGNVTIISSRANSIKTDATFAELRAVARWVGSFRRPTPLEDALISLIRSDCAPA